MVLILTQEKFKKKIFGCKYMQRIRSMEFGNGLRKGDYCGTVKVTTKKI